MKIKTQLKLKLTLSIIFFIGVVVVGYFVISASVGPSISTDSLITSTSDNSTQNLFGWKFSSAKFPLTDASKMVAYSSFRVPEAKPSGLPVRLQIPMIGVDSAIEDALITFDGRMDVPAGSVNVAWFALGPHPGSIGSAVIGGHFGIKNGVPFVFYNLDKLKIGDKAYVVNDLGKTLAFQVRRIESFDRNADATTVFTSDDGLAHLNIITCEGVWNEVKGNYPLRLIVFTDAIPSEGAVVVKPLPVTPGVKPKDNPALPVTAIGTSSLISASTSPSTSTVSTVPIDPRIVKSGFAIVPDSSDSSVVTSAVSSSVTTLNIIFASLLVGIIGFVIFRSFRK